MVNFQENLNITLVLADDHEVVRAGLRRLLSIDKNIRIIDEAANGEDAVQLTKYHQPDIVLLDILMPKLDGIGATSLIKSAIKDVKVVILTAFEDSQHLEKALEAGADGYLAKDISARDLVAALHDVMIGKRVFSKSIIRIMQNKYSPYTQAETETVSISPREQEILNLVAIGKTSPQIADELNISVRTVQTHRSNIMQKLGLQTGASLIRYAVLNMSKPKFDKKG